MTSASGRRLGLLALDLSLENKEIFGTLSSVECPEELLFATPLDDSASSVEFLLY